MSSRNRRRAQSQSRRSLHSRRSQLNVQRLEERSVMATITGGTGPGGFILTGAASDFVLWNRADSLALADGANVDTWADSSGRANDLGTRSGPVTFVASGSNGVPAVQFGTPASNTNGFLQRPRLLNDGQSGEVFFMVQTPDANDSQADGGFHRTGNNSNQHYSWDNNLAYENFGTNARVDNISVLPAVDPTQHNIYNVSGVNAGAWAMRLNGEVRASKTSTGNSTFHAQWYFGRNESNNEWQGQISEIVMLNRVLNTAERVVLQNYLHSKYAVIDTLIDDRYVGDTPANGNFDREVFGIGRNDASNQVLSAGQAGFGIEVAGLDDGDFVLAGHKVGTNTFVTTGIAGTGAVRRFDRSWYVDVTDANNNVGGTLAFDYSDAGGLAMGAASTFKLLYSTDGGLNFTDVGATATFSAPDQIKFNLSAAQLQTGVYTLGDAAGPQLATSAGAVSHTVGTATTIDPFLTVAPGGNPTMTGGAVSLSGFVNGDADVLNLTDTVGGLISGAYNSTTGVLTLSGNATAAQYQQALRSVTFDKVSFQGITSRVITFSVTDAASQIGSASRTVLVNATAFSQTIIWSGLGGVGGTNDDWSNPANWVGGQVPDSNDIARFGDATNRLVDVSSLVTVGGIDFNSSPANSFTISTSTSSGIVLTQPGIAVNAVSNSSHTISAPLALQGSASVNVDLFLGSSTLTISGAISGSLGLTKLGNQTLILSGTNTYTGTTAINGGTLRIGGTVAVPAVPSGAAGIWTFDSVSGTTVNNAGSTGATNNGTLQGSASVLAGGIMGNAMNTTATVNARMDLAGSGISLAGGNWTAAAWFKDVYTSDWRTLFRGSINDHQIIIENGTNNLGAFDNAGGTNFRDSGYDLVAASVLGWHHIAAVGTGTTTTYYIDGVAVGSVPVKSTTNISTVGAYLTGTQRFAQWIDEVYIYQSALSAAQVTQLYNNGAGIGVVTGVNSIPDGSQVNMAGGTLDLNGVSETVGSLAGFGTVTSSVAGAATLTTGFDNANASFSGTIQIGSGTVSLTKIGNGTQQLSGANTYGGTTTVNGGTLQLAGGNDRLPVGTSLTLGATGTLDLNNLNQTVTGLAGAGRVVDSTNDATFPDLTVNVASGTSTFSGILGNTNQNGFDLFKTGGGTLSLAGTTSTFTGKTTISGGGTLSVNGDANLGTAPGGFVADAITIANNSTLNATGAFVLNANRGITLGTSGATLNGGFTYGGRFAGGTGITKTNGDLVLTNTTAGTNPGPINVNSGRLFYVDQNTVGTGAINIANGASFNKNSGSPAVGLTNAINLASGGGITNRGGDLTLNNITLPVNNGTAIFNSDDAATNQIIISGAQTLTNTFTVQVGGNNASVGLVRFDGALGGGGNLAKTQVGTLHLNNGGNSYSGVTTVSAGTLRVSANGALGQTTGGTVVSSGGTLQFDGAFNYSNLEPLTISGGGAGGVGAINKTNGSGILSSNIFLASHATIGSATAGSKLTLAGALTLSSVADITFTGAGDIDVNQGFGNGNSSVDLGGVTSALALWLDANDIDGAGNGPTGDPTHGATVTRWEDKSGNNRDADVLTNNPVVNSTGLNGRPVVNFTNDQLATTFNFDGLGANYTIITVSRYTGGDNERVVGSITRNFLFGHHGNRTDRWHADGWIYQATAANDNDLTWALYTGALGPDVDGVAGGSVVADFWSDGVQIISDGPGAGANYKPGRLAVGAGNGGAFGESSNSEVAEVIIYDRVLSNAERAAVELYLSSKYMPNSVIKNGTGTVTLLGNNSYNGTTTVNAGTLVSANAGALGSTVAGTTVKSGGTLGFSNASISGEAITVNGTGAAGQSGAVVNVAGTSSYTGTLTAEVVSGGSVGIGSNAGTLTLNGTIDLKNSQLAFNGAGNLVVNSNILGNGSGSTVPNARFIQIRKLATDGDNRMHVGEVEAFATGVTPNGSGGATFGGMATSTNDINNGTTAVFGVGNLLPTVGTTSTLEHGAGATNPNNALESGGSVWSTNTTNLPQYTLNLGGTFPVALVRAWPRADTCCTERWRNIEFHLYADNGFGAPGALVASNTTTGLGQPGNVPHQINFGVVSNNSITKSGSGTVTLAGSNTYDGTTTVSGGTLIAAHNSALGTGAGGTSVAGGATLGLSGGVTISNEPLTLNGTGFAGQPGALANVSGNNIIAATSPITAQVVSLGQVGIGSTNDPLTAFVDTLTIAANIDLKMSQLVVNGDGNVVLNGAIGSTTPASIVDPAQRDYILGNVAAALPGYSPLSFWEFNQASGTAAPDSGTTNTTGTLTGAATRSTGRTGVVGTDYALDTRTGGTVTTTVTTQYNSINVNDKVTLGFWLFQDPVPGLRANTTFQALNGGTRVAFTHAHWNDNNIYWDAGQGERVNTTVPFANYTDGWHHYILTKSSSGPNFQAIYRDGVQIVSGTGSQLFADITSLTIAPDYRGQLDDVFLLNTALTATDVTNLWNARNGQGVFLNNNGMTKNGAGTLSLGGNNSYNGTTTVNAGVLLATNTAGSATSGGAVTVSNATLGGTGAVGGTVQLNSGGRVAPGLLPGTTGTLRVNNTVTFASGSHYDADLASGLADKLEVTGGVTVNAGVNLNLPSSLNFVPDHAAGQTFQLIDNQSGGATGAFANIAPGAAIVVNVPGPLTRQLRLTHTSGTGANDVALVTENRIPINVSAGGPYSINEGSGVILNGAAIDEDGDVLTIEWDLDGDGTFAEPGTEAGITTLNAPLTAGQLDSLGMNDGPASFAPRVRVKDSIMPPATFVTSGATTFVVANLPPTINTFTVPTGGAEGSALNLLAAATDPAGPTNDPLTYTWTITSASPVFNQVLLGANPTFTPPDNGTYNVALVVTDGDGGSATMNQNVVVANVAPKALINGNFGLNAGSVAVAPGQPVALTFGWSDPGAIDVVNPTRSINWGDGSPPVTAFANGVSLSHIYTAIGSYTITETVTDKDLAQGVTTYTVTVLRFFQNSDGNLVFGGENNGSDKVALTANTFGAVTATHTLNSVITRYTLTPSSPNARVLVFGQGQDDDMRVSGAFPYAVEMYGGGGNDYLAGGPQNDLLDGGVGNDRLLGGLGDDTTLGGAGLDSMDGGAGNDTMDGGDGNDTITGNLGNDSAFGGLGIDKVGGAVGNDYLDGGEGNDAIDGGAGNDVLVGGNGADTLNGGDGLDLLLGGAGLDVLNGGNGDDILIGDDLTLADPYADAVAIRDAWATGNGNYDTRVDDMIGSLLNASMLIPDNTKESLTGGAGLDWFLFDTSVAAKTDVAKDRLKTTVPLAFLERINDDPL